MTGKLRSTAEFGRVFREARGRHSKHLVVYLAARPEGGEGRYGLVVSRKVGKAVARNRVRRQLRAAVTLAGGVGAGWDAVVIAKPGEPASTRELSQEIWQIMERVGMQGSGGGGRGA